MSGHSKWSKIKRQKGAIDEARSKVFQKIAREIYVAAKNGDKDPKNNPNLRAIIEKARGANMPNDRVNKAIEKASGAGANEVFESVRYEGYGPGGVAVIVDCLTDNRNRTAPMVREAFTKKNGNLGTDGSVSYMFERKGIIVIPNTYNEDDIMMNVLDNGALDFSVLDDAYEIITTPEKFISVKDGLSSIGVSEFIMSEITFISNNEIEVSEDIREKVDSLIEKLEDIDDVQNVYHNMKD
jgi:YebC/PmpR family DNA-binding regulatory protein